jgi:DNA-binding CsgD family transcriptional regulator
MTVRAMKAGAVEFLTKPFRDQDLLDAVNVALQRDRTKREKDEKARELRVRFESLSDREREVVSLVITGMMNNQIAAEMKLSEVTVKVHRHNAMKKLGEKSLPDLVRMADVFGVAPRGIARWYDQRRKGCWRCRPWTVDNARRGGPRRPARVKDAPARPRSLGPPGIGMIHTIKASHQRGAASGFGIKSHARPKQLRVPQSAFGGTLETAPRSH